MKRRVILNFFLILSVDQFGESTGIWGLLFKFIYIVVEVVIRLEGDFAIDYRSGVLLVVGVFKGFIYELY